MKKISIYREGNPFMDNFSEENKLEKVILCYGEEDQWKEIIKKIISTDEIEEVYSDFTAEAVVKKVIERAAIKYFNAYAMIHLSTFDAYRKVIKEMPCSEKDVVVVEMISSHFFGYAESKEEIKEMGYQIVADLVRKGADYETGSQVEKIDWEKFPEDSVIFCDHHVDFQIPQNKLKAKIKLICPCCMNSPMAQKRSQESRPDIRFVL